jgi:hypothetical protein
MPGCALCRMHASGYSLLGLPARAWAWAWSPTVAWYAGGTSFVFNKGFRQAAVAQVKHGWSCAWRRSVQCLPYTL